MWEWIASNHQVVSALANIAMLVVWIAYLQVFVSSYRRQKRPNILVNRGAGSGLEARCLISNMSAEAIYIESLIATVETPDGSWSCPVTETDEGRSDQTPATRQGPMQTGQFADIGSFRSLIEAALRVRSQQRDVTDADDFERIKVLEIKVIAVHGSEHLLAGAKRRFDLIRNQNRHILKGQTVGTHQIRSRRARARLRDDVRADL